MRKIFLIILTVFLWLFGYAQFPITQNLGAPSTLVLNKGGFKSDSALVIPSYSDTTRANQSLGKTYPGNIIRVGNLVYIRNFNATGWILVGSGGGGGGSFDTVYAKYPIRVDTTGVKDTLYLAQPFLDSVYNNSPGFLDGLVSTGGVDLVDTSAIVIAPIIWKRNGVVITQNTNALFPIPRADTLNFRVDIIYINSLDSLVYVQGIQDTANAIAPALPPGGILITYVNVYGSSRIVNPAASNYQRTGVLFVDLNSGQITADSTRLAWNQSNGSLIIGNQAANSNPSAILQLTSNNKGFLMPTMSAALRNGISSPANGLMVYDTDSSALFYYDNTQWKKVSNSANIPTLQQAFEADSTASPQINARNNNFSINNYDSSILYGQLYNYFNTNSASTQLTNVSAAQNILSQFYVTTVGNNHYQFPQITSNIINLNNSENTELVVAENKILLNKRVLGGIDSMPVYVGISTPNPTAPLHVVGSPRFQTDSAQAGYVWTSQDNTGQGEWRVATAGGADSSVFFTNFRADTMRASLYANKVPYTGATGDVDLGTFKMNAQSFHVKGTAGNGHIGFKHQSAAATAGGQETSLYADNNGDIAWQNANQYRTTLLSSNNTANRIYTYPDSSGTLALLSNVNAKQDTSTAWKTGGNFNVNAGQFIGSINNAAVRFRANNTESFYIDSSNAGVIFPPISTGNNIASRTLNFQGRSSNGVIQRGYLSYEGQGADASGGIFNIGNAHGEVRIFPSNGQIYVDNSNSRLYSQTNGFLFYNNSTTDGWSIANNANQTSGNLFQVRAFNGNASQRNPFTIFANGNVKIGNLIGTTALIDSGYTADITGNAVRISNTAGLATPNSTALLDLTSINRGLLIPRMTTTQRDAISTPATGLMVWNTTDTTLNQYTGNTWRGMVSTNPSGTINYTAPTQTGSSANGILDLAQTWNTTGTPTAIKLNVTNTASNSSSLLMDLQVGGSSVFRVDRTGNTRIIGNATINTINALSNGSPFDIRPGANLGGPGQSGVRINPQQPITNTSGTSSILDLSTNVGCTPSSGNMVFNTLNLAPTINQTGGANGITRGLYVNPTLTAAADWRAIETTNGQLRMSDTYAAGSGSLAGSLLDLSQTWNTTGNPSAIKLNVTNTASGSTASLMDLQVGGTSYFTVDKGAKITQFATNTAAGTTGNQTINRPTGTVNIAAAGTTVTVTNNLVTANSLVFAVIRTNDTTAEIKNVVPGAGTFTINLNAAATAETSIGFWVIN